MQNVWNTVQILNKKCYENVKILQKYFFEKRENIVQILCKMSIFDVCKITAMKLNKLKFKPFQHFLPLSLAYFLEVPRDQIPEGCPGGL